MKTMAKRGNSSFGSKLILVAKVYVYVSGTVSLLRALVTLLRWLRPRCGFADCPALTYATSSRIGNLVAKKGSVLTSSYRITPWLFNGLAQTLSSLIRMRNPPEYSRQKISLEKLQRPRGATCCPDIVPAGQVSVDWLAGGSGAADDDIVIIVPGLTGHSKSTYIERVAAHLAAEKYRVACYNPRGRGGNVLTTPFLYCVGFTEDLRRVVNRIKDENPTSRLFAVGYSLGSNYLSKYVGEEKDECVFTAAVSIACPIDCVSTSNHLASKPVQDRGLVSFDQKLRIEYEHLLLEHSPPLDLERLRSAKTMDAFDDALIAPMFGFSNSSDYYRYASSGLHLDSISIPTLFLHAKNDGIVPGHVVRLANFRSNPHLVHAMLNEGAHSMDFPEGWRAKPWAPRAIAEFFRLAVEARKT